MNLAPHYAFTMGLAIFIVAYFPSHLALIGNISAYLSQSIIKSAGLGVIYGGFTAYVINEVIDIVGHKEIMTPKGLRPVRLARTHSIYTAPIWGIGLSVIITLVLYLIINQSFSLQNFKPLLYFGIFLGFVLGPSHLILDSVTQGGIYTIGHNKGEFRLHNKRLAFAHYKYNNKALNSIAVLVGLALLTLATNLK